MPQQKNLCFNKCILWSSLLADLAMDKRHWPHLGAGRNADAQAPLRSPELESAF